MLHAVLELVGNLVVANAAFTHTCLQLLVYSFLPPPGPPPPVEASQGEWALSAEAAAVQAAVITTLEQVRGRGGEVDVCGGGRGAGGGDNNAGAGEGERL